MRTDWSRQPRLGLKSNFIQGQWDGGMFQGRGLSIITASGSSLVSGLASQLNTQWQLRPAADWTNSLLGETLASTIPLDSWLSEGGMNLEIAHSEQLSNILGSLQPVHVATHESLSPLVRMIPSVSAPTGSSYVFDLEIFNLLSSLISGNEAIPAIPAATMLFSAQYDVYLGLTGSGEDVQAQALIPHNVMVQLGLIPGADEDDPVHMNPEQWLHP